MLHQTKNRLKKDIHKQKKGKLDFLTNSSRSGTEDAEIKFFSFTFSFSFENHEQTKVPEVGWNK